MESRRRLTWPSYLVTDSLASCELSLRQRTERRHVNAKDDQDGEAVVFIAAATLHLYSQRTERSGGEWRTDVGDVPQGLVVGEKRDVLIV